MKKKVILPVAADQIHLLLLKKNQLDSSERAIKSNNVTIV